MKTIKEIITEKLKIKKQQIKPNKYFDEFKTLLKEKYNGEIIPNILLNEEIRTTLENLKIYVIDNIIVDDNDVIVSCYELFNKKHRQEIIVDEFNINDYIHEEYLIRMIMKMRKK